MKNLTGVMVRKDVTRPLSADSVDTYDSTAMAGIFTSVIAF